MSKMLAVVGPTACGKSELAVELAKKFDGEVVSCDSMQIYKMMNIGTAKPDVEEMQGIKHHLIDFLSPGTDYSVSDYVKDAEQCCEMINVSGKLPIFCGGTGLYISSFLSGIEFGEYDNKPEVRERLLAELSEKGVDCLYERLCSVDSDIAGSIDKNNHKRVLRALEVYETTGVTMSEWNRRSRINAKQKDCLVIGLDYMNRDTLYSRIDTRVDIMMSKGLLEEARMLYEIKALDKGTAAQAIAYKEFIPYFNNESSLDECVETLKRNSRRYAKRQLTWFRRNENIKWIFKDDMEFEDVKQTAFAMCEDYLRGVK